MDCDRVDRTLDLLLGPEAPDGRNIRYHATRIPSPMELKRMMRIAEGLFFPGYFGDSGLTRASLRRRLSASLDELYSILSEQIKLGICFESPECAGSPDCCEQRACELADEFMDKVPQIRDLLDGDVRAAYDGDPAAKSISETIFCYPSIRIMTSHRIAHELYSLGVPLLPRIISELAHSRTGADIHPGASIGPEFFIDHGTGVVIGETAIIGRGCTLYQGVTLGALSFPKDEHGNPIKDLPRHPILEDGVTVYGGATILGRITIGRGSMIGGNVWITKDVPPGSKVVQQHSTSATERMTGERA